MNWQINVSSKARLDIDLALQWTLAEFGRRKHDEYVRLIEMALMEIGADPETFRAKSRPELHSDARVFHIGRRGKRARHLFVYRIRSNGKIDLARFLYDSIDIERHLPEEFGRD